MKATVPAGCVIVFRFQSLLPSLAKNLDHGKGLRRGRGCLDPSWGIGGRLIEPLQPGLIIGKIRPAHSVEISSGDEALNLRGLSGCGTGQCDAEKGGPPNGAGPANSIT